MKKSPKVHLCIWYQSSPSKIKNHILYQKEYYDVCEKHLDLCDNLTDIKNLPKVNIHIEEYSDGKFVSKYTIDYKKDAWSVNYKSNKDYSSIMVLNLEGGSIPLIEYIGGILNRMSEECRKVLKGLFVTTCAN